MTSPQCPTCKKAAAPRKTNAAFPFCSVRCKTVDLGKWFNEEYRVPAGAIGEGGEGDESGTSDGNVPTGSSDRELS